jgi:hypothetical protein
MDGESYLLRLVWRHSDLRWRSQTLSPTRRPIAALMRRTTLSVIQKAAFGTTFSASGGDPPVVRWLPIDRDAYKSPHSSTKRTRTACTTGGREGIAFALLRRWTYDHVMVSPNCDRAARCCHYCFCGRDCLRNVPENQRPRTVRPACCDN